MSTTSFRFTGRDVRDLQDAIQSLGQLVTYQFAGAAETRELHARVRYLTVMELANAEEQYALQVTLDARDFAAAPPMKGDSITMDGTRRGVMSVREVRGSGALIAYTCGVQG